MNDDRIHGDSGLSRETVADLQTSEAHYRALVEQSITGVSVVRDGVFQYVNRRFAEMFGYAVDDLVGRLGPLDIIAPEDHDLVTEEMRKRLTGEVEVSHYQARGMRRDGHQLWLEIYGTRVDFGDESLIMATLLDVTERVETEAALAENRRFLETLVDNLPGVVYRCRNDPDWTMEFISDACGELVGYTAAEFLAPGEPTVGNCIHPEDSERVWAAVQDAATRDVPFRLVYRMFHRDGRMLWVWERGRGIRDEAGNVVGLEGFLSDITEQKHDRDELQRLADRLYATLESITDAFCTFDSDWRFTYVNGEAERIIGRSRDSLLGSNLWDELPYLRGSELETRLRQAREENRSTRFEYYSEAGARWYQYHVYPSGDGLAIYFRDITRERQDREQIEFLALYDPVTRLPNRKLLEDRATRALATCVRDRSRGALLFIDLDDFKSVNDSLGHNFGDMLLQQLGSRLSDVLRDNDTVARFGGDEFAVLLEGLDPDPAVAREAAHRVAAKVREALGQPCRLAGHLCHPSASIGVADFGADGGGFQDLLRRADLAMYRAKESGRDTVCGFEPEMETAVAARMRVDQDLRQALDQGEITVHYQPQVDVDGRVTGAEALARWNHPERGWVSPAEFIPVAEHTGLIVPLGRFILEVTCRQLAAWTGSAPERPFTMAVNVSARQFHQPDFVDEVVAILERTGADGGRLRLEITETMLLQNIETSMSTMAALQEHGILFSLDDFGTGYSSLAYLKSLPLARLKIDQTFVRDMATDANDAAIVRAIIMLARALELDVIAEGVETEEVRTLLIAEGCREFQGYHFARPMPAAEFSAWFRASDSKE